LETIFLSIGTELQKKGEQQTDISIHIAESMTKRTCEIFLRILISFFALTFFCSAIGLICFSVFRRTHESIPGIVIMSIISFISFITYLILCCFSETPRFLYNQIHAFNAYEYIHRLKDAPPTISMHIQCYHYETRYYHEKDANGKETTKSETVRVDTYSEKRHFKYQSWEDISDLFFLGIDENQAKKQKPCLRLYLKKNWIVTDEPTLNAYQEAKSRIIYENRWRDQYIQYTERMDIPGFKGYIMALVGDKKPPFFHFGYYILSVLLFLVVPYCFYIDYMSYTQEFTIQKKISVLPKIIVHQNFENVVFYEREPSIERNIDYNPNAMPSYPNNTEKQHQPLLPPPPPPHQYQQQGYVPVEGDYVLYQQSEIYVPSAHK
jgi:hypothetical protein